jgi:hypothetical protein
LLSTTIDKRLYLTATQRDCKGSTFCAFSVN